MNRTIQSICAFVGSSLSFILLLSHTIPEWVGIGYIVILFAPLIID